ncbi:MAG: tRNA threonylcarbamoyladenosine dehydratase [Clostridia bacterium]|nr:tRNA threonylcarbamoyladenosine dehydratase [Clostridia bacterium]MBN2882543.1 tRNA threonylcarbamoyladenosine dehydratase [Clostridia bacterium]
MNDSIFGRTNALLGSEAMKKLHGSSICLLGLGGVGSYAFEALVRAGIGRLIIVDHARVDITNINRQLIALESTIGRYKTEAASTRATEINPNIKVECHNLFIDDTNIESIIPDDVDYIVDAIDSVSSKLVLAEFANKKSIPVISCMGTGNKLHPEKLMIGDISKTSVDPLARVMRTELKKRGIKKLEVVWSDELPLLKGDDLPLDKDGRKVPASISYVPSAAGILMASVVVNRITGNA